MVIMRRAGVGNGCHGIWQSSHNWDKLALIIESQRLEIVYWISPKKIKHEGHEGHIGHKGLVHGATWRLPFNRLS